MWDKVKKVLVSEEKIYTGIYTVFALGGWISNGVYKTSFNTTELAIIFGVIMFNMTGKHFINSKLNSPIGEMPTEKRSAE